MPLEERAKDRNREFESQEKRCRGRPGEGESEYFSSPTKTAIGEIQQSRTGTNGLDIIGSDPTSSSHTPSHSLKKDDHRLPTLMRLSEAYPPSDAQLFDITSPGRMPSTCVAHRVAGFAERFS